MRELLDARSRAGRLSGVAALVAFATLFPGGRRRQPPLGRAETAGVPVHVQSRSCGGVGHVPPRGGGRSADPAAYRAIGSVVWLRLLYERGAITADDYLGSVTDPNVKIKAPAADVSALFHTNVEKALQLGEAQLRRSPSDAEAQFNVGAALGQLAAYTATVDGSVFDAIGIAHRAFDAHERVLELDPSRKDAGLVLGSYRYAVSNLGAFMRMMARLAGLGGGRERAITLLEDCSTYPSDAQTESSLILELVYNREKRYDDALRLLATLRERYPRNRLLWLETAATELRAGRPAQALVSLETGVAMFERDPRTKAFGEAAQWYGRRGAALVALGERARAEADLRRALAAGGREWVLGRCHTELGKLADLSGNRTAALAEYRQAAMLCAQGSRRDRYRGGRSVAEAVVRAEQRRLRAVSESRGREPSCPCGRQPLGLGIPVSTTRESLVVFRPAGWFASLP